jgi:hypothetical protein
MGNKQIQINPKTLRKYILIQLSGVVLTLLGTFISISKEMNNKDPFVGTAVFSVGIMLFILGKYLLRNRKK